MNLFLSLDSVNAWSGVSRRSALWTAALSPAALIPKNSSAKCADIETCREIGDSKIARDLQENPRYKLDRGVTYKVLKPGVGSETVKDKDTVDIIFSIAGNERYMYSRGFGYEKINMGGKMVSDLGTDSYLVKLGRGMLPKGIEQTVQGMKRGERRRVVLPPAVGFATSNWKPEPQRPREKLALESYRRLLEGNRPNQPPSQMPTIWDIEVVSIRS
jgi:hypothetical protein